MPKFCEDICIKKPDIFVWIIHSRDMRGVDLDALRRVCWSAEQNKWSARYPHSDRRYLTIADTFLELLRGARPFSICKEEVATVGHFPSMYNFWICEFPRTPTGEVQDRQ
jgi:hypothetical protein